MGTRLSEYELKELTQRGDPKAFEAGATAEGVAIDEGYMADRIGGLGAHASRQEDLHKKLKQQQQSLSSLPLNELNKLSGEAPLETID